MTPRMHMQAVNKHEVEKIVIKFKGTVHVGFIYVGFSSSFNDDDFNWKNK